MKRYEKRFYYIFFTKEFKENVDFDIVVYDIDLWGIIKWSEDDLKLIKSSALELMHFIRP